VQADPDNGQAHYILGVVLLDQNDVAGALEHFSIALRLWPATTPTDPQFTLAACHNNLGLAWLLQGDYAPAATHLAEAARLKPEDAQIRFSLAATLAHQGLLDEPLQHYQKAISLKPELDKLPQFYDLLAANYAKAGRFAEAVQAADKALRRAKAAGRADIAQQIQDRLRTYQANAPNPPPGN
jgi:tetratricopeptide (TPR) repeat protein